jgi:antitoxin HigA-1
VFEKTYYQTQLFYPIHEFCRNLVAMVRIPTDRPPTHPGEMLLTEFLESLNLTQRQLADSIHVPYQRINEMRRNTAVGKRIALSFFTNV